MPKSISSTVTSIDATQRKLIVGIVIATLMALAITIADLASGGRPDPPALRAAATLLDGAWRFHTGDDPRWADANTDDNGWETIDLTAVPGSHDGDVGLPDYVGRVDGARSSRLSAATPGTGARWRCRPEARRGTSSGRPSSRTATNSIGTANG
jgi:hypothetical protein